MIPIFQDSKIFDDLELIQNGNLIECDKDADEMTDEDIMNAGVEQCKFDLGIQAKDERK